MRQSRREITEGENGQLARRDVETVRTRRGLPRKIRDNFAASERVARGVCEFVCAANYLQYLG